jgi:hypothetical protein
MVYSQLRIDGIAQTSGVVESIDIITGTGGERFMKCPQVTFRYVVANQSYQSPTFYNGGFCSTSLYDVDRLLAALHVGSETTVYYNPAQPPEAYLMAGLTVGEYFALLFFCLSIFLP